MTQRKTRTMTEPLGLLNGERSPERPVRTAAPLARAPRFERATDGPADPERAPDGEWPDAAAVEVAATPRAVARRLRGLDFRSRGAVLETAVLTFALPLIGWGVDHGDPFFIGHPFSWLVFAPLLVALRHGFTLAFASAAALDIAIVVAWRTGLVTPGRFPGEHLVGLAATAMVAGQFSDVWMRGTQRLASERATLRKQRTELARAHLLLELSHDRLDRQLGRATGTLRSAVTGVRALAKQAKRPSYATLGDTIMELFAVYCMIEIAEFHTVVDGEVGERCAVLGEGPTLDPGDPLLGDAIASRQLVYAPTAGAAAVEGASPPLLAAVPFVDSAGRVSAVLCVWAMPFIAFQRENLETLATLAGHLADVVAYGGESGVAGDTSKERFEAQLGRAVSDLERHRIPSLVALLAIPAGAAGGAAVEPLLDGALRDLEVPYVTRDGSGNVAVYILLPGVDETAASAFEERLETTAYRELDASLTAAGGTLSYRALEPGDTPAGIFDRLGGKHDDEFAPGRVA
jgi:polysaccharide biosynthesis protein PelD